VCATYTATCNGNLVIDTLGSTVADTVLVAYNGAAPFERSRISIPMSRPTLLLAWSL
jgi:hypothetical protein